MSTKRTDATQQELDANQYSVQSILNYQLIYGQNFVSPGGQKVARELITTMNLPAGARVLDAGCGLGGSAFLMAEEFALQVEGIDLSENMLKLALEKSLELDLRDKVALSIGDCLEIDKPEYYDAIYSRDVFLHIANKRKLFNVLYKALKPNGKLLFTDYCCGDTPWASDFSNYVDSRGYSLHTLPDYSEFVAEAGFVKITWKDCTEQFIAILQTELRKLQTLPEGEEYDSEFLNNAAIAWQEKIVRAKGGDQRWGLITAAKP